MGNIKVGAAKVCINPKEDMMPYPSFNKEPFTAVFSDCNMRAIVIETAGTNVLILGYDTGGIPTDKQLKKKIEEKFGILAEHILMTATHNHTGCDIVMSRDEQDLEKAREYQRLLENNTYLAVEMALNNMRSAKYGYGEGNSYVNGNRDMRTDLGTYTQGYEPEGYCDRTVSVMKFVDDDDQLIAAVVNYGMHATLGFLEVDVDGKTKISGNIPGFAQDYAEARFGNNAVVLWTSAAAGDQNPQLYCIRDYEQDGFPTMARTIPGLQYNMIKLVGKQHGVDICRTINSINKYNYNMPVKFGETNVELPTQKFDEKADMGRVNWLTNHVSRPMPGEILPEPMDDPDHAIPLYIQEMVLGDVAFVGIAAEIYSLIGKACKEVSPYKKTMVVTHVDRSVGYIIDKTSVDHKCFEQFGRIKAGACDEIIEEGVRALFDEMMKS